MIVLQHVGYHPHPRTCYHPWPLSPLLLLSHPLLSSTIFLAPLGYSWLLFNSLGYSRLLSSPLLSAPLLPSRIFSNWLLSSRPLSALVGRKDHVCRLQYTLYVYQEANNVRYLVKAPQNQGLPSS